MRRKLLRSFILGSCTCRTPTGTHRLVGGREISPILLLVVRSVVCRLLHDHRSQKHREYDRKEVRSGHSRDDEVDTNSSWSQLQSPTFWESFLTEESGRANRRPKRFLPMADKMTVLYLTVKGLDASTSPQGDCMVPKEAIGIRLGKRSRGRARKKLGPVLRSRAVRDPEVRGRSTALVVAIGSLWGGNAVRQPI